MPDIYRLGKGRISFPGRPSSPVDEIDLTGEGEMIPLCQPREHTFKGTWKITNVGGFPVKGRPMQVRHKATGRAAMGWRTLGGCLIVQFDNISAMGWLAHNWHLYPRHHFKRRKPHVHDR